MMVFLVRERGAENIEKMEKIDKRKTLKNEEKEKQIIRGKSNKNKRLLKTVVHTITFYLQLSPSKRIKDRIKGGLYPRYRGYSSIDTFTMALVCIFSSNFSHSWANRRNSIIKE